MLEKHLIVKTYPKANEKNIVLFGDYRVTVLFDRLFRIEKNKKGEFLDDATQSIWYRNMPKVDFEIKTAASYIEISTAYVTLHLAKTFEKSYILIDGKRQPINNDGNLLGTTRTLDCYDGEVCIRDNSKIKLGTGVCSRTGVAVVDDTESLRLLESGKLESKSSDEFDIYVFAYGNKYREAVKALFAITGNAPLLPRFAFGNWWSRYHAYTDEEYIHVMDEFEKYGIPLTVATVDMDWHYSNDLDEQKGITASGKIGDAERGTLADKNWRIGWTGYSWNQKLFPDYKAFLKALQDRNLKVTLNLHPADGVRYFEDMYEEMAKAMGVDPKSEKQIKFDIADDNFVNNYFKILHHPYERDGVDFWWIDWQQGTNSALAGLDPLWALNHYHFLDNGRDGKHALLMSRYAGIGSHRYPMGFSGDTVISWATLAYLPYFTATSSNIGYTWWGHDFGGHFMGVKDNELYLRFMQFAVFNPIMRMHCTDSLVLTQEPWAYENGISELVREALRLRHRMIPFLHSANNRTHSDGLGLMEPMYYEYPEYEDSYRAKDQYIFGGELIAAPITEHSEHLGLTRKQVWLPEGSFTDIFTGDVYNVGEGGRWVTMVRPLNSIPVLAKSGAVIPLSNDSSNSTENPKSLEALVFSGNNTYKLYEDNELGVSAYTVFENKTQEGKQAVKLRFEGKTEVLPEHRDITLTFKNIVVNTAVDANIGLSDKPFANITVLKNGKPIDFKASKYSTVSVTVSDIDYTAEYEILVEYSVLSELSQRKREVLLKLQRAEGAFSVRSALSKKIKDAQSTEKLKGVIMTSDLSTIDRIRLSETVV
ncbi:MAG: alpha-xylosidase [Clostridia bacterium]|nr:alpha-xylosidase [Clostridia bacterium]